MNIRNTICLPLTLALLTLTGTEASAQNPFFQNQPGKSQRTSIPPTNWRPPQAQGTATLRPLVSLPQSYHLAKVAQTEVQKALAKVKSAEDSAEKEDAKDELLAALSTEYDDRMDAYDEHIESLEKQLEEMRERLSRRRKAKEEVVELKLKQLVAESDGLGWPGASGRSSLFVETSPFGEKARTNSDFLRIPTPPASLTPATRERQRSNRH